MRSKKFGMGALLCSILLALALVINISPVQAADEATIEASIEKGLAWLASVQDPVSGAWHYFTEWEEPCYDSSVTALVLLKFVDRAKELGLDPFGEDYEYSSNVVAGFDYLFTQAIVDEDRIYLPCLETYNTGTAMIAVSACPDLSRTITTGPLAGQTFGQALQGMMNWMVYAQQQNINYACDEGGWDYGADPNDDRPWADQSNTGYATIGVGSARNAGISVPPEVLNRLNTYITNVQDPMDGDNYDGGSWYEPCESFKWVNILKTGNLLYEMALYGDSVDAGRVQNAISYIEDHWNDSGQQPEFLATSLGWMDSYQAMFTMMKGLEGFGIDLIDTDDDGDRDDDWFDEVSDVIVANQGTCDPGDSECFLWIDAGLYEGEESAVLRTAWALLTLERVVEPPTLQVPVDIKPMSCRNPLNVDEKGVLPVAILGTADLDVTQIDPATVMLSRKDSDDGVSPLRWALEDVETPFEPLLGKQSCTEDCHAVGPDGYMDLTLKFNAQEVVAALGEVADGDCLVLTLTGNLKEDFGGTPIVGEDVVVILEK